MDKFSIHTGKCLPLYRVNVDTDQIVPKKFLLKTSRKGFSEALFYDWRYNDDGTPDESFVLNDPKYKGASILVTGENFGCGSSREHAPWALEEYGFRAIIAPSFAEIFYSNCFKIGLLPIRLREDEIKDIRDRIDFYDSYELTIDLALQSVSDGGRFRANFEIDLFHKDSLLRGLDLIDRTLIKEEKIAQFEQNRVDFIQRNGPF